MAFDRLHAYGFGCSDFTTIEVPLPRQETGPLSDYNSGQSASNAGRNLLGPEARTEGAPESRQKAQGFRAGSASQSLHTTARQKHCLPPPPRSKAEPTERYRGSVSAPAGSGANDIAGSLFIKESATPGGFPQPPAKARTAAWPVPLRVVCPTSWQLPSKIIDIRRHVAKGADPLAGASYLTGAVFPAPAGTAFREFTWRTSPASIEYRSVFAVSRPRRIVSARNSNFFASARSLVLRSRAP